MKIFMLLLLLLLLEAGFIIVHESAHSEVNRLYGCTSKMSLIPPRTVPTCNFTTTEESSSWNESQSNVEAIGYQINYFGILIIVCLLILAEKKR